MPVPLPMATPDRDTPLVECVDCAKCCTYVAVGINAPTRPRYATDILWYLYHDQVRVYLDGAGEWCVIFETRCRNLGDDRLCGIYPLRPHICRAFDNRTCDVNDPEGETHTFTTPAEFLAYLRATRPRVYRRIEKAFIPEAHRIPSR